MPRLYAYRMFLIAETRMTNVAQVRKTWSWVRESDMANSGVQMPVACTAMIIPESLICNQMVMA